MAAWEKAGQWQSVMSLAAQLGHSEEEMMRIAHRVASKCDTHDHWRMNGALFGSPVEQLCVQKQHQSAARLMLDYAHVSQ